jgi:predicted component of type VI protein secretion system
MHTATPPRTMQAGRGAAEPSRPKGKLGLIRPDGSEGGAHVLTDAVSVIGRGAGPLFDHDSYLSPRHARFALDGGRMILEDAGSLNGVFVRITQEEPLQSGDVFRIGQELVRFDAILEPQVLEDGTEIMGSPNPGYWGRLSVIMGPGIDGSAFPLMGEEMVLGRERGDILFSDDGYVSGIHAKISVREDGYFLTDLGSSNGTFVRLTQPRVVLSGIFVLIGQQLFRLEF